MAAIAVTGYVKPDDPLRAFIDRTAGRMFVALRFTPNQVTILGTAIAMAGCVLWIIHGHWLGWGLTLGGTALDSCDGSVARLRGMHTPFGRFLDSTTDRIVETAIWAALLWTCSTHLGQLACLLGLAGSFMVSYTRSKAEQDGLHGKDGWGPRHVRLPLLAICVLFGSWFGFTLFGFYWVVWPAAGLAWLTVVQRVGSVRHQLQDAPDPTSFGHGGQL